MAGGFGAADPRPTLRFAIYCTRCRGMGTPLRRLRCAGQQVMGTNSAAENRDPTATRLVVRPGEVEFRRFRVRVVAGPDQGATRGSDGEELSIGTDDSNHLTLSDPTVSGHHCEIRVTERGLLLRDLESTNGTLISDLAIESAYLQGDVTIKLGDSSLRVESLDDRVRELLRPGDCFDTILGASPSMRRLFAIIERIAPSESTVLLEGETGTGKTLIAETLHEHSLRSSGPFVVVDCGAIPPTLIESELFGHEKGAFTGAHMARDGAFVSAAGGTIFLDEIGELPLSMQPKLLRALEERVVKPVGSTQTVKLDIRLMAATNRDLRKAVNSGAFRSDLYYRLNTVRLRVPPLRERREDIPQMVAHFYKQFVPGEDEAPPAELVADMLRQPWPGNVRELRGAVERAVLLGDPELWATIAEQDGASNASLARADEFDPALSYRAAKERAVAAFETWFVTELVRLNDGNLSRASRAARMDRNHLRDLMRKHKLTTPR